jgi:pilus assembly protein CpaE
MKTHALVVANDPAYRTWLQEAGGSGIDIRLLPAAAEQDPLEQIEAEGLPDIVFCEFDGRNFSQRTAFVERFSERHPQVPVVGIAAVENSQWMLAAMRGGARDFFVLSKDDATLPDRLTRLLRRSSAGAGGAVAPQKQGKLYVVLSSQPHESLAFLAEHLALGIVETVGSKERVLLVDIATPPGAAAIFLNISATYTALDAVKDAYRCDQTLVNTAFPRHGSGLHVLSLPEDLLGAPPIDSRELLKLLQVLRGLFDRIVIDLDGHLPLPLLAGVVREADRMLLLSDQSILKSRLNKHLLRALRVEGCNLERAGLVVDDYRRRLGLEPRNLAELFEIPLLTALQGEPSHRVVSMNSGEPLYTLARKDPYTQGIKKLAESLVAGQTVMAAAQSGFFDRLKGV